jgi:RimJ/RimL family protein N-acetyltransferase
MGFIQEGEFKQHVFIDGRYLDIVAMAVLRENYDKQKQPDDSSTLPQD